jgi:hypothetical protein
MPSASPRGRRRGLYEFHDGPQRVVIGLLVTVDEGGDVLLPVCRRDVLDRERLLLGRPQPPEIVPHAAVRLGRSRQLVGPLEPVDGEVPSRGSVRVPLPHGVREQPGSAHTRMQRPETDQLVKCGACSWNDPGLPQLVVLRAPPELATLEVDIVPRCCPTSAVCSGAGAEPLFYGAGRLPRACWTPTVTRAT